MKLKQKFLPLIIFCLLAVNLSAFFIPSVKATQFFAHGFEGGDFDDDPETGYAWNGTGAASGCSVSVQSDVKIDGTYAAKAYVDGGADKYVRAYYDLNELSTAFARVYFQLDVLPPEGKRTGTFIWFVGDWYPICGVAMRNSGGVYQLILLRLAAGATYYQWDLSSAHTISVSVDTWYCVEIKMVVDGTNGEERVYWEDEEVITSTGRDNDGKGNIDQIKIGFEAYGGSADWERTGYYDWVVVADTYIGLGAGFPQPPTISNIGTNTTVAGQPCLFHAKATADNNFDVNVSGYIFGWDNGSDTMANDTWVDLGGDAAVEWLNITDKVLNYTIGATVHYQWYVNDTYGNWTDTGLKSLNTTSSAPAYSNLGYAGQKAGYNTTFRVRWSAMAGTTLNTSIFSWNNTGPWVNFSYALSGTIDWHNTTKTLNDTVGVTIQFKFYGNASTGVWTTTDTISFVTCNFTAGLHVEGKNIKDADGNIVYLRGTNRGHFEDGPTGGWGGFTIFLESDCETELGYMESIGINALRLYTQVDYWKYNTQGNIGGGQTMPHRDIVKTIIEIANESGIYVIYCPWSVSSAKQAAFPYPTTVLPDMQAFVDYWVSVVNELGGYQNVIWEIWNEPGGGLNTEYTTAFQAVIDAIRDTGDDHIIIVGRMKNIAYLSGGGPVFEDWVFNPYPTLRFNDTTGNLVYTAHIYRQHDSFWDGSEDKYKYDDVKTMLQSDNMQVKRIGDEWGLPLLIGEIGPGDWGGNELENTCLNNCLLIFNEWGISYTAWDWDHTGHWNMFYDTWTDDPKPRTSGQILINALGGGVGENNSYVVLNSPSYGATVYTNNINFNYTPTFYQTIQNSSLWLNISGTWQRAAWNSSAVQNDTESTIAWNFLVNGSATYIWNVEVFNSSQSIFALYNRTLIVKLEPYFGSPSWNTTLAGYPCNFTCVVSDGNGLGYGWLETNNSGPYTNETEQSLSGTSDLITKVLTLNSTVGVVIRVRFFANDSDSQVSVSSVQYLTTTAIEEEFTFVIQENAAIYTEGQKEEEIALVVEESISTSTCIPGEEGEEGQEEVEIPLITLLRENYFLVMTLLSVGPIILVAVVIVGASKGGGLPDAKATIGLIIFVVVFFIVIYAVMNATIGA